MRLCECEFRVHVYAAPSSVRPSIGQRPTKDIKKYFLRIFIYIIDIKEAEPIPNRTHTHTHTHRGQDDGYRSDVCMCQIHRASLPLRLPFGPSFPHTHNERRRVYCEKWKK